MPTRYPLCPVSPTGFSPYGKRLAKNCLCASTTQFLPILFALLSAFVNIISCPTVKWDYFFFNFSILFPVCLFRVFLIVLFSHCLSAAVFPLVYCLAEIPISFFAAFAERFYSAAPVLCAWRLPAAFCFPRPDGR